MAGHLDFKSGEKRALKDKRFSKFGSWDWKGSFGKGVFSEVRDSREPPGCGKQRRIRPFSRDSREFRDPREFLEI